MSSSSTCLELANFPSCKTVQVSVPATSANLGAGFDSVGIALDIWVTVKVTLSDTWSLTNGGTSPASDTTCVRDEFVVIHFMRGLASLGIELSEDIAFRFEVSNDIPLGRGLGSSASAIVAALACAFLMAGRYLHSSHVKNSIGSLAASVEGHVDNALPAIYGGLVIGLMDPHLGIIHQQLPFPDDISLLVHYPKNLVSTQFARSLLPIVYARSICARAIGRAALLISALSLKNYENLKAVLSDEIHQPYREKVCPDFASIKAYVNKSNIKGVYGAYLSGSGPCTVIICDKRLCHQIMSNIGENLPAICVNGNLKIVQVAQCGMRELETQ